MRDLAENIYTNYYIYLFIRYIWIALKTRQNEIIKDLAASISYLYKGEDRPPSLTKSKNLFFLLIKFYGLELP